MKTTLLATVLLLTTQAAIASPYEIDKAHTEIGFAVTHLMVSKTKGTFRDFNGTFDFDEKKGLLKDINIEIQIASIDTHEPKRDGHLRSPDFFNAAIYPTITFTADPLTIKEGKHSKIKGMLTIKGVTKLIELDLMYNGRQTDPYGIIHSGFSLSGKINRMDFGVRWNAPLAKTALDKGGIAVGEEVTIDITGEIIPHVEKKEEKKWQQKNQNTS